MSFTAVILEVECIFFAAGLCGHYLLISKGLTIDDLVFCQERSLIKEKTSFLLVTGPNAARYPGSSIWHRVDSAIARLMYFHLNKWKKTVRTEPAA